MPGINITCDSRHYHKDVPARQCGHRVKHTLDLLTVARSHPESQTATSPLASANCQPPFFRVSGRFRTTARDGTDLQLAVIPWILVNKAVHHREYTSDEDAEEGEPAYAGRPSPFFLEYDGECAKEELSGI